MTFDHVLVHRAGDVARITMNRPDQRREGISAFLDKRTLKSSSS